MNDLLVIRILFILIVGLFGYFLRPFNLDAPIAAIAGAVLGAAIVVFEIRLKQVSLKRLIGAAFGSVLGILGAYLVSLVLTQAVPNSYNTVPFLQLVLLCFMAYIGLVVGANKGDML